MHVLGTLEMVITQFKPQTKQQHEFSPQRHSFPPMVCLAHQSKCTLSERTKLCYNGEQVN